MALKPRSVDLCWSGFAVSGYLALLALSGCETASAEVQRTEPWRKDEVALLRTEREVYRYRAEGGQYLHFTIASKQGSVRGKVPLSSAELSIDPRALDHSRGELTFDLGRLSIEGAPAEAAPDEAPDEDRLLTQAARAWLSLGSQVLASERKVAEGARFRLRLGRELSSHSISGAQVVRAGGPRSSPGAGRASVRRVSGSADGELLLLGREVSHVPKVEIDFLSGPGEGASEAPASLVVRLARAEAVPLLEHDIEPKDERGAVMTEQAAVFGRRSNLRALVTGSLSFVRAAPPESTE